MQDRDHDLKFMLSPEASTADMKTFRRRFGPPVFGGYGSSENAIVMMPSPGQPPEALGVPAPGLDIAVMDPTTEQECPPARFDADGQLVNADEAIGELVGRNALDRFEGYYNNDAATRERTRSGLVLVGRPGLPRRATASSTSPGATPTGSGSTGRTSRPRRSSGSSSASPGWPGWPCSGCPTTTPPTTRRWR